MLVRTADPAAAVEQMVTAWDGGGVPVLVDPDWPAGVRDAALAAAGPGGGPPRMVLLTSGSTARPRPVVRTLRSWTASYPGLEAVTGIAAGDVIWAPGSAASTLTLFAALHARLTGLALLATGRWRGVPDAAVGVTVLHAVPGVLPDVLAARAAGRLPELRLAVVGGAQLPAGLREAAAALGVQVVAYYGAAELSFVALDTDGHGLRAFPGVRLRIRDSLVEASSPFLAEGRQGWAGVGDRGTLHGGVLQVLGRGDGTLDVGGHLVELAGVESALSGVPGVAELACAGAPDPLLGRHVVALLCPQAGADPLPALRRAAGRLPRPSRPVRWVLLPALPRTPAGKPDRAALGRLAVRS